MPPRKPRLSSDDQLKIEAARQYFPIYAALVHKTDDESVFDGQAIPAAHHKLMMRTLQDDRLGHTLMVLPRGAGKTAMLQFYIEWEIGRASLKGDKDWAKRIRFLFVSHKEERAADVSIAVMHTIEGSELYHAIFPAVKPSKTSWSQSKWRLAGNEGEDSHPNFEVAGIASPPLGGRYDKVFLDDIADPENMNTKLLRERIITTIVKTLRPMLPPWGRFIMACTRWHYEDPAAWAMEEGWHTLQLKALQEDETGQEVSYWPERFTVEKLLELRGETQESRKAFAQQYQNEVTPEEGLTFERWWFQRRFDLLPDPWLRIESWDLASTTGRKSDWSVGLAMVVARACPLCQGAPWHIFIPHMFRGKLGYGYVKMAMKDCYQLMGGYSANHYMVVEKKSVGEALAGEGLHELGRAYPIFFRSAVGEGRAAGVKDANIRDVAELCRQGNVHLPGDNFLRDTTGQKSWLYDLERELFGFEPGTHTDDVVSAFLQGVLHIEDRKRDWQRQIETPVYPKWGESQAERAYA